MEPFLNKFFPEVYNKMKEDTKISNYCKFHSQLLTSFTSSLYVAGLISSFLASPITKAFGRKPSILIGGAVFLHVNIWSRFTWSWSWVRKPGRILFIFVQNLIIFISNVLSSSFIHEVYLQIFISVINQFRILKRTKYST